MDKNTDFIGSLVSNPYKFQKYDMRYFLMFVNGIQFPNESLSLGMNHENSSVIVYKTLYEASGIHHFNSGSQITQGIYIQGVPGGKDLTSGECSLGQTIPI